MHITIYGSGYVGLVTGACLAEVGNHVLCADIDIERVNTLNSGHIPIYEPDLEALVQQGLATGRLQFTADLAAAVHHGQVQCIAVGTPANQDGSADLHAVSQVAQTMGRFMEDYKLIINKSTVPVGTAEWVRTIVSQELKSRQVALTFDVVSNPEFLKEGDAVNDFRKPDRIIVGTDQPYPTELMRTLYAPFNRNRNKLLIMDVRSAELTKYAANALLATKISFMNEMANLAERVGADIEQVRLGLGSDPRIGFDFIYPGCGYGGSCFPKDVRALQHTAQNVQQPLSILHAVEMVNTQQPYRLLAKIQHHFPNLQGRRFALWGLAFKPNTSDMREAPSGFLMEALWQAGALVQAYDPQAMSEADHRYGQRSDLQLCPTPETALIEADALIIMTEWKLFRSPDFKRIHSLLKQPLIFDGRNLYDPQQMAKLGFTYYGVGRGARLVG